MSKIRIDEITLIHADFCKSFASPRRLLILHSLGETEKTVSELSEELGFPMANLSQHLNLLKSKGAVKSRKVGQNIYYSIADKRILKATQLIRDVIVDLLKEKGSLVKKLK
ncbi:metalloregulator ArsR/SmtB family transcription factor [Candidatus Aminicenantes bacterium AC-335-K20]|jgi:ArsR family transcriptional regulator|nr:metalloregulator ArsR/SmtB family transcription factor [SCandidatus Aminicenantes bacterium Aminicenantia_JdfR_composite]MCP2606052.1 metalloregulator ArsR/SmtB family transcription factor [Candidatus Aminicenantes bacterium AC-708-I09]MCP2618393.1 metalloregulator ArsR/SmtB family transcription factor [Candidatus Aminicenantes bacterium AC-335-A11]MCP2619389.1 metalloregulator ArsR/SmtB family transcription factor [Candidatus Aminicenantes bacterium AC-335-K20]MCP2620598.1 metalloregulator 